MDIVIKQATNNNIPTIVALASKIWRAHYPGIISNAQIDFMLSNRYSEQALLKQISGNEKFFLVSDGQTPVAYASIEERNNDYYIHKFYVDISLHRSGIGTALFQKLIAEIKTAKPVRLQVNRKNYKAINFYFKNGFVIESVGDFDIGGGYFMEDFVMVKKDRDTADF
jgi:ribosomal protein S18 acetylase RimI-like enzyme